MVHFKIYDVTNQTAIITIHIVPTSQEVKAIQAINFGQLQHEKYLSSKIMQRMRQGDQFLSILVLIYFGRFQLGHEVKTNFTTFQSVDFLRYQAIWILQRFVIQSVTSEILKLTIAFLSSCFSTQSKMRYKNVNVLRTKRAFNRK